MNKQAIIQAMDSWNAPGYTGREDVWGELIEAAFIAAVEGKSVNLGCICIEPRKTPEIVAETKPVKSKTKPKKGKKK